MANVFVNKKVDLTSNDSATTLYTVPSATTAIVKSVFSIVHQKQIPANEVVQILTQPLVIETGEIVKVTPADTNRLHVILSAMQVTPRTVTT